MAAATISSAEWGYSITGGTDATTISTGRLRIKAIGFSGNADNATCTLTTLEAGVAVSFAKFKSSDTGELNSATGNFMYFGESGIPVSGLACTLSNASDHLYIYLTS